MTELDGLFKIHEATDATIVASGTLPKRNIALARDTNQLLIRKEDNTLLRVMTGDRLERSNPTATGTITADAFRVSPTAGATSSAVGTFFWDAADHTASLVLENGSELQLGREAVQWCKNSTGTAIPNGSLVYISGATGDNPTISLASATVGAATGDAIGMATQTIPGNGEGMVATNISFVRGLDTSTTPPGTRLWLSTTPGTWSSAPPARPNYRVQAGFVLRQHANQGIVLLWIVRYPAAAELSDVDTTGATTGQGLVYGADGVWRPGALLALGEASGTAYRGDRGKTAYDHSQVATGNPHGTTAAQVGAMPAPIQITGAINFNSINGGAPGIYRLEGSSYTNAPGGATSTTTYSLWQGVAGGRITQVLVDGWYGGMLHREQLGNYANAWSAWAEIWDSTVVPISLFAKSLLNDTDATTARNTLNAAVKPSVGTQAGNWTLGTSTPTGTRQTGSGTLTLPAASATYAGLSYTITATTTLTLTIAGTFCYLDANSSASYWYDTATSVAFSMNGGHTSGVRKQIEIYCDGAEWLVKC